MLSLPTVKIESNDLSQSRFPKIVNKYSRQYMDNNIPGVVLNIGTRNLPKLNKKSNDLVEVKTQKFESITNRQLVQMHYVKTQKPLKSFVTSAIKAGDKTDKEILDNVFEEQKKVDYANDIDISGIVDFAGADLHNDLAEGKFCL